MYGATFSHTSLARRQGPRQTHAAWCTLFVLNQSAWLPDPHRINAPTGRYPQRRRRRLFAPHGKVARCLISTISRLRGNGDTAVDAIKTMWRTQ